MILFRLSRREKVDEGQPMSDSPTWTSDVVFAHPRGGQVSVVWVFIGTRSFVRDPADNESRPREPLFMEGDQFWFGSDERTRTIKEVEWLERGLIRHYVYFYG